MVIVNARDDASARPEASSGTRGRLQFSSSSCTLWEGVIREAMVIPICASRKGMSASATLSRFAPSSARASARRARHTRRAATRASAASPVESASHVTDDGVRLEVLSMKASSGSAKPPMVFVHGSYHAAWCWAEHFFEYFSSRGHDCYALSMRGQGASDMPPDPDAVVAGTVETHASDVASFCASLSTPPVLVGHSFGGLIAQRVAAGGEEANTKTRLAGLALVASVPPTGNGPMVGRFLRRAPLASLKITYAFIAAAFKTNAQLCRECFFSLDLPEPTLVKHMGSIANSCNVRLLDLKAMNASLPIPKPPEDMRVFVVGGEDDFVVDVEGLRETAVWGNADLVVLERTAHDVMLDTRWEGGARALEGWMETL